MEESPYKAPMPIAHERRTIRFLPYDSFVLRSTAPADDLMERLKKHVFRLGADIAGKAFSGELRARGFILYRLRSGARNCGRPILCGRLKAEAGGTAIRVRMRPNWFTIIFMLCWFGLCGRIVVDDVRLRGVSAITLAAATGIALFAYLLIWIGFWSEAAEARRTMTEILTTQPSPHRDVPA